LLDTGGEFAQKLAETEVLQHLALDRRSGLVDRGLAGDRRPRAELDSPPKMFAMSGVTVP
jgi:hypothetical protein